MFIKLDSNNYVIEAINYGECPTEYIDVEDFDLTDMNCWKYENGELIFDEQKRIEEERRWEGDVRREQRNAPVLLQTQYISREEFNLLDAQDDHTLYYILEEDGTTTMLKGENR